MFLTRCPLNPVRRGTRTLLASPQAMHAAVLSSFPPDLAVPDGRVLWRIDRAGRHELLLYVVSPGKPDLTHVVEQAGWPTLSGWDTRDYDPLLQRLDHEQVWAFRVTANPVHQVRDPDGGRGRRLGHVTVAHQRSWLLQRAEDNGFVVIRGAGEDADVVVSERETRQFRRGAGTVTLVTARFDGHLRVTQPDKLRATLTQGLGRAKGYGCGLLTLAQVQQS